MNRSLLSFVTVCASLLVVAGCSEGTGDSEGPLSVFVSIPPQASIVEAIGGSQVRVGVLVPPGQEPHTFEPTPRQMTGLGSARLYLTIGIPFETHLLARIRGRTGLLVADMAAGIRRIPMAGPGEGASARGNASGEPDPHVWLSPRLIRILARNAEAALVRVDPVHEDRYRRNLTDYLKELDTVDRKITEELAPYRGRRFLVFHPAFGYFAAAYGLIQESVEVEGKSPAPRQLQAGIARARDEGVKVVFVQPEFDRRAAESVARAIDGAVVPLDPLGRDLLSNLQDIASKLRAAFSGKTAPEKERDR